MPRPFRRLIAALALGASAACGGEYRDVAALVSAPRPAATRVVTSPRIAGTTTSSPRVVTSNPSNATAVGNPMPQPMGVTEAQPGQAPAQAGQPDIARTPPEVAAAGVLLDDSARQANRLRRVAQDATQDGTEARRAGLLSALADIEAARALVRDDLQRLSTTPTADAHDRLRRDTIALKDAMRASYAFLPPADSGLPQPSPLPSP
ncbi:MAG: hypothetical protein FWD17_02415 [Polyangiaceae bacterium]|nr:hypothetical protein [Polyangiaceae bacterium]